MDSIYVIEDPVKGSRWVVVAETAADARDLVTDNQDFIVGRIGTYEPGPMGARLTDGFPVVAYPGLGR